MQASIDSLPLQSSSFTVRKMLNDRYIQQNNQFHHKSTQTKWNRHINKIIQYEFNDSSLFTAQNGNNESKATQPELPETILDDLLNFLDSVTDQLSFYNDTVK